MNTISTDWSFLVNIKVSELTTVFPDKNTLDGILALYDAVLIADADIIARRFNQLDASTQRVLTGMAALHDAKALKIQQAPRIDSILFCDSALSKAIFSSTVFTGEKKQSVFFSNGKKGQEGNVTVSLTLTFANKNAPVSLTMWDRVVFNTIVSAYRECQKQNAEMEFTPAQIARTITGQSVDAKVSKNLIEAVNDSIQWMSQFTVTFDPTELFDKWHIDAQSCSVGMMSGPLLPVMPQSVTFRNGLIMNGYILRSEPILSQFDRCVKHVKCIPRSWLSAAFVCTQHKADDRSMEEGTSSGAPHSHVTKRHIVIAAYLGLRVAQMKYEKKRSKSANDVKISISQIYDLKTTDVTAAGMTHSVKHNIRHIAVGILENWRKAGIIAGYEPYWEPGNSRRDSSDDLLLEEYNTETEPTHKKVLGFMIW